MHPQKLQNILNLSSEERYGYLIRTIADTQEVWIIKDQNTLADLGDEDEKTTIPIFPEQHFAELLLIDSWASFSTEIIDLDTFMLWLDEFQSKDIQLAGFPKPDLTGVVGSAEELRNHILHELQQYE